MMLTKRSIGRRTVLRGVGTALALPVLDSLFPAFGLMHAQQPSVRRLSVVYVPNGIADIPHLWVPEAEGTAFELRPIMAPVARFRDRLVVVSGLDSRAATYTAGGGHARASGTFLTGVGLKV